MSFMKKAVKWIIVFGVIFVVSSFLLPREIFVSRMTAIDVPPDRVFGHIESMQKMAEWSPWSDIDPEMKVNFSGPETGIGNSMTWQSDHPEVGAGSQVITVFVENERVGTSLDFGDMGKGHADILISEKEGGTAVEWHFKTDLGMNPVARWAGLMISESVGTDYERGLDRLKAIAEAM